MPVSLIQQTGGGASSIAASQMHSLANAGGTTAKSLSSQSAAYNSVNSADIQKGSVDPLKQLDNMQSGLPMNYMEQEKKEKNKKINFSLIGLCFVDEESIELTYILQEKVLKKIRHFD